MTNKYRYEIKFLILFKLHGDRNSYLNVIINFLYLPIHIILYYLLFYYRTRNSKLIDNRVIAPGAK